MKLNKFYNWNNDSKINKYTNYNEELKNEYHDITKVILVIR